jgi:hypothetical protein
MSTSIPAASAGTTVAGVEQPPTAHLKIAPLAAQYTFVESETGTEYWLPPTALLPSVAGEDEQPPSPHFSRVVVAASAQ